MRRISEPHILRILIELAFMDGQVRQRLQCSPICLLTRLRFRIPRVHQDKRGKIMDMANVESWIDAPKILLKVQPFEILPFAASLKASIVEVEAVYIYDRTWLFLHVSLSLVMAQGRSHSQKQLSFGHYCILNANAGSKTPGVALCSCGAEEVSTLYQCRIEGSMILTPDRKHFFTQYTNFLIVASGQAIPSLEKVEFDNGALKAHSQSPTRRRRYAHAKATGRRHRRGSARG